MQADKIKLDHLNDLVNAFNVIAGRPEELLPALRRQAIQINEEVKELTDALAADVNEVDLVEVLDGVCDSFFTVMEAVNILEIHGIPARKAILDVCENNLTKFPTTFDVVEKSIAEFEKQGRAVNYRFNKVFGRYVLLDKFTQKILKPVGYQRVQLEKYFGT